MEVTTMNGVNKQIQEKENVEKSQGIFHNNIYFTNDCHVVVEKCNDLMPVKKKRGRPKKLVIKNKDKTSNDSKVNENLVLSQSIVLPSIKPDDLIQPNIVKRGRGRPKKNKIEPIETPDVVVLKTPKKRGRKKKIIPLKEVENKEIDSDSKILINKNAITTSTSIVNENGFKTSGLPGKNVRYLKCITLERFDEVECVSNTTMTKTPYNNEEDIFIEFNKINWDFEVPKRIRSKSLSESTNNIRHRRNSLSNNFVFNLGKTNLDVKEFKLNKTWKSLSYLEGGPNIQIERYQSYELNKKFRTELKRSRSFPNCMLLDTVIWRYLVYEQIDDIDESYIMLTDSEINLINEMTDIPNRQYRSKSLPIKQYKTDSNNYINKSLENINMCCYPDNLEIKSFQTSTNVYNSSIENVPKDDENKIRRSKRLNNKVKCIDMLESKCIIESDELKIKYLLLAEEIQHETEKQLLEARKIDAELDDKLKKLNFTLIACNLFRPDRKNMGIYTPAEAQELRKLKYRLINYDAYGCNCTYTKKDWIEGNKACGNDCLNRSLNIECGPYCPLEKICTNRQFQNKQFKRLKIDRTANKGYGVFALEDIPSNTFINEYVGEVIDQLEMLKRMKSKLYRNNNYMVQLKHDEILDATCKGNITRFINHSCEPNCTAEKWSVLGESKMGFMSNRLIKIGEEITFDYSFETFGPGQQKCFCGTSKCRGFINRKSKTGDQNSDDNEYIDFGENKNKTILAQKHLRELDRHLTKISLFKNKNRSDLENSTINLNKFMVHITDSNSQSHILKFIRNNDLNCKKLFMNFNGLSIIHSWMKSNHKKSIKLEIIQTLSELPIANRNTITKSKVLDVVEKWANIPNDVKENIQKLDYPVSNFKEHKEKVDSLLSNKNISPLVNAARNLWKKWIVLKTVFVIPKLDRTKEENISNVLSSPITSQFECKTDNHQFEKTINNKKYGNITSKLPNNNCVQNEIMQVNSKTNSISTFSLMCNRQNEINKNKMIFQWNKKSNSYTNMVPNNLNSKLKIISNKNHDIPTIETSNNSINCKKIKWNTSTFNPAVYQIMTESNIENMEYYPIKVIVTANQSWSAPPPTILELNDKFKLQSILKMHPPSSSSVSPLQIMAPENTSYEAQHPSLKDQLTFMSIQPSVNFINKNIINISDTISNKADANENIAAILPQKSMVTSEQLLKQCLYNKQKLYDKGLLSKFKSPKENYIDGSPMKISQSIFKKNSSISHLKQNKYKKELASSNLLFKHLKIGSNFYQEQLCKNIKLYNYKLKLSNQKSENDILRIMNEEKSTSIIDAPTLAMKLYNEQLSTVPISINIKKLLNKQSVKINTENSLACKIFNGLRKKYSSMPKHFEINFSLDNNKIFTISPTKELELHHKLIPTVINTMCARLKKENEKHLYMLKQNVIMKYDESKLPKPIELKSDNSILLKDNRNYKRKSALPSDIENKKRRIEVDLSMKNIKKLNHVNQANVTCAMDNAIFKKPKIPVHHQNLRIINNSNTNIVEQNMPTKISHNNTLIDAKGNESLKLKKTNNDPSKIKAINIRSKPLLKCLPFNNTTGNILATELEQHVTNLASCSSMNYSTNILSTNQLNNDIIEPIVNHFNASAAVRRTMGRVQIANDPIVMDYIQRTQLKTLESRRQYKLPESMMSLSEEILNLLPDNPREIKYVIDFYHGMANVIVKVLDSYVKTSCVQGRIKTNEDFKFLAKKLNSNILYKELQVKNVENLRISESVKLKVENYIKKYMLKFGKVYKRKTTE